MKISTFHLRAKWNLINYHTSLLLRLISQERSPFQVNAFTLKW